MATTISKVITFIPTIGGNHDKPEGERIEVKLRAVKVEKKQAELRKFVETPPKELMKQMMNERQQGEIKSLLNEHFIRFVNFDVKDEFTKEMILSLPKEGETPRKFQFLDRDGKPDGEPRAGTVDDVGKEFSEPMTMANVFETGEFELAMEIFMFMIGSSQLRRAIPVSDAEGNKLLPSVTEEREDEEKNSESPSGISTTH